MKKLITILYLVCGSLLAQDKEVDNLTIVILDNRFDNNIHKATSTYCDIYWRSDYQNEEMTNGVYHQINWQKWRVKNDGDNVYVFNTSIPKLQRFSGSDLDWISNKLDIAGVRYRIGNCEGTTPWLKTFLEQKPEEEQTNAIPVSIGDFDDSMTEKMNDLFLVAPFFPADWTNHSEVYYTNILYMADIEDTPTNRGKLEDQIIKGKIRYIPTQAELWYFQIDIKNLPNGTLDARDTTRDALTAAGIGNRPFGYLRKKQKKGYMGYYQIEWIPSEE